MMRQRTVEQGDVPGKYTCLVIVLAIYLNTLHPSVPGGDGGELIVAAYEFGVAHPPGYPLFTLLAHGAISVIPLGSVAWRVNFLCGVLAALSSTFLYVALYRFTGMISASVLGVGLFTWSRLTWQLAVTAEVFSLNSFLLALLLLLLVRFHQAEYQDQCKISRFGACVCGLALSNQHTSVVYIFILAIWILASRFQSLQKQSIVQRLKLVAELSLFFFCGLAPYIYLPFSAYCNRTRWTWGDQRSVSGFLKHILRYEYGTFDLLKDHSGEGMYQGILKCLWHIHNDLTPVCLPLLILLLPLTARQVYRGKWVYKTHVMGVCVIMLLLYLLLISWRANLDTKNPLFLGVVERFWLQSDLIIVFLVGTAFSDVCSLFNKYIPVFKWKADVVAAVMIAVFQLQRNLATSDQSGNYVIRDFANQILQSMPEGALVLTKGDLPSTSFRYLHVCEGVRPDLSLLDQEILTLDWSVLMIRHFYSDVTFPGDRLHLQNAVLGDGTRTFNFKRFLDVNYNSKHLIFGCIGVQEHETSWVNGYELWPFGVCKQFVRKGSHLQLDDWLVFTQSANYSWSYPLNRFDDRSWEKVANDEMWSSRISVALHLQELAELYPVGQERAALLGNAYRMYKAVLDLGPNHPAYWHKNLALVCEKLYWSKGDSQDVSLLKETLYHLSRFLELDPADADADKIRTVLVNLKTFLSNTGT